MEELQENFIMVIIRLRVAQLYYHYCHNLTYGPMFVGYHEIFKDFYTETESQYDKIIEYTIAELGRDKVDTMTINKAILAKLSEYKVEKMSPEEMISTSLEIEQDLYSDLEVLSKGTKIGLQNALGDIAEASDVRVYKLKQLME